MEEFKEQVRKSFSACKSDISNLQVENLELKRKINNLEEENFNLKQQILQNNNSLIEIKAELKGLTLAFEYIKKFTENSYSNNNYKNNKEIGIKPQINIQEPIFEKTILQQKTKDPYEALLAFKAKVNKRDILKQKILSMINEEGINLSELKFMFVEHFKYCSKATFYNYLKELEFEKIIKIEREHSKNFIYINNRMRQEMN